MISSDLKVYKAGADGRKTNTVVQSGVVQNVFTHVKSADRITGKTDHMVTHWGLGNTDNKKLIDPAVYQDHPTLSDDDYVVMCQVGQRVAVADWQATIDAADKKGCGILAAPISNGDTVIQVTVKHANLLPGGSDDIFKAGYLIKACSHSTALATDGVEQIRTISGTPTFVDLTVTITVSEAFTVAMLANGTSRISSLIVPGVDTEPTIESFDATGVSGTVDEVNNPIVLDNIGTPEQDWSFDWINATTFSLSGDTLGELADTGTVGVEFAPLCPETGRPYLTVPAGMFSGSFAGGDQLTMTTHPATVPTGQKRVVQENASSLANNLVTQVYEGEAA